MIDILTILRNCWARLISYLKPGKPSLTQGEKPLQQQLFECKQAKVQQQKFTRLLAIILIHVLTEYRKAQNYLNNITTENESLNLKVQELQQQCKTFEIERDEFRVILTKLRLQNTLLEQKVEQLESHKKILIQELGGSLSSQDIEFLSWEFLIQKVKEVTKKLYEVIEHNQSLIQIKKNLEQEQDNLIKQVEQVENNNTRLRQDNLQLQSQIKSFELELKQSIDRINVITTSNKKLEKENLQLGKKVYEIKQLEYKIYQLKSKLATQIEEVEQLNQVKQKLELEVNQEQVKVASLEQKNRDMEKIKNQLERVMKQQQSNIEVIEKQINSLNNCQKESKNSTNETDNFLKEISRLNQIIDQLKEMLKQSKLLKPDIALMDLLEVYNDLVSNILDETELIELYNGLVFFVQTSLSCAGIDELDEWEKTEEFYVELISRLCFIDTLLITKIKTLEIKYNGISCEHENYYLSTNYNLTTRFRYPGKFLFWSNGQLYYELSSFFL